MKILLIITKAEIGGAQIFVLNLAKSLKLLKCEVTVAAGEGDFLEREIKKEGLAFHRFKSLKRGFNPFKSIFFVKELNSYLKKNSFNVIHLNSTNTLLALWSRRIKNIKKIFTIHGLSLIDDNHKSSALMKKIYQLFFKLSFKKLDHFVFVSHNNFNFAKKISLLDKGLFKKASIIYNGLSFSDDYFFNKDEAREKLKEEMIIRSNGYLSEDINDFFSQKSFIYGSIGRLAYPKNYEFLISSFKEVKACFPEVKLLLIGDGPERAKYEAIISAYNLKKDIIILGEIKEASRYLKAFNVFVLPSVFEGLSLSLIETIFAKVPALATLVGGNEEVLGRDSCFELNNFKSFLKKFKKIHKNQKDSLDIHVDCSSFSAQKMAKDYLNLYLR